MAISGELIINLAALARNYNSLDAMSASSCETAAAVKANAYGLGVCEVVPALFRAGARTFFVATLDEAIAVRNVAPLANVCVFNGFVNRARDVYIEYNLIPVLNSLFEIELYRNFAVETGTPLPAIIHFDTGMNRLGVVSDDAKLLCEDMSLMDGIDLQLIISHFSSSEEMQNPLNSIQYERFKYIFPSFTGVKKSLCNSAGLFLSQDYHLDVVRPGIALYGGCVNSEMQSVISPVVSLNAPILQIHSVKKGETVGYNETHTFSSDGHVAVISVGYADGLLRSMFGGSLYWQGYELPICGRVSMDLLVCDLSNVPQGKYPDIGGMVEVIGENQSINDLAVSSGTIPYEIITSLGSRYNRSYIK
ncbi:MAG: alanine racemase [Alphaproteobacteria bacterium]